MAAASASATSSNIEREPTGLAAYVACLQLSSTTPANQKIWQPPYKTLNTGVFSPSVYSGTRIAI
jgi:hypothetical protein